MSSGICWEVPPKAGKSLRRGLERTLQTQTKVRRALGAGGGTDSSPHQPGGGDRAEGTERGLRLQPWVLASPIIHSAVEGPPPTQQELPGSRVLLSPQWIMNLRKSVEMWSLALNIRDLTTDGMRDTGRRKGYRWSLWIGGSGQHA